MKKHIVCFGDSNTHGYCAMNDGRFDENERWTCLLQKELGEDYLILEEGLSGRTTCFNDPLFEGLSGLDYIYPCLMSHEPVDLLIIMLGTNDTKERFGASSAWMQLSCSAHPVPHLPVHIPSSLLQNSHLAQPSWQTVFPAWYP